MFLGELPKGSLKLDTIVRINEPFDKGGLKVGTVEKLDLFSGGSVNTGSAKTHGVTDGLGAGDPDAGTRVYVTLSADSTVGDADVWVTFLQA